MELTNLGLIEAFLLLIVFVFFVFLNVNYWVSVKDEIREAERVNELKQRRIDNYQEQVSCLVSMLRNRNELVDELKSSLDTVRKEYAKVKELQELLTNTN